MTIWNLFNLMGGLALFIFGMNLMSDGLKLAAGSYLKNILETLTKNQFVAVCVGAGLTALIQSSNAMCVMVVGFVGAGMMTNPGVAAKMFEALYNEDINISMISTSEIRVTVLIDEKDAERAATAVHDAFKLAD